MLVTGICHTDKMIQCPHCEARIPMDAQRCPKCGVRILIIRRRRSKNHRTAKEKPSGDLLLKCIGNSINVRPSVQIFRTHSR